MKKIDIEVSNELFEELRKTCIVNACSMREVVVMLLNQYYDSRSRD